MESDAHEWGKRKKYETAAALKAVNIGTEEKNNNNNNNTMNEVKSNFIFEIIYYRNVCMFNGT